ncbi:hypothetical protein WJX75_000221 [Coccomyxa subellipsoidea]|uniref:Uncharacterized protein n=1 Tax=Coccomyxa subellipsoidea TaxID=248742 RepID=A0ABR2YFK0_9CHLO
MKGLAPNALSSGQLCRTVLPANLQERIFAAAHRGAQSTHKRRRPLQVQAQCSVDCQVSEDRRRFLLNYVQKVEPQIMEQFAEHAPAQVVDAMRTTISNMVGVLPPHLFDVTVSTVGESLAQLMFSVIMTGYLFRNAQYRLDLQRSMDDADGTTLPPVSESATGPAASPLWDGFAEGSQKTKVQGEVLRWHNEHGATSMPAAEYITMLENEVAALRKQVMMRQYQGSTSNELLDYLKCLDTKALGRLTACAGDDIMEAMNAFIHRLLGSSDDEELRRIPSQSNAVELARLLFWLMCVGYGLRTLEVRFDMEQSMMLEERDAGLGYLPP